MSKDESKNAADQDPTAAPKKRTSQQLLIWFLVIVVGVLFGMVEQKLSHPIWPTLVGLLAVLLTARWLIGRWIADPTRSLINDMRRAMRSQRPTKSDLPPMTRRAELGDLARMVHELSVLAYRQRTEADQLRRTMDDRVSRATRQATRHLQEIAMRDVLTGLGNRRFMETHLESLVKSCRAAHADLICIAIDMDHFKRVNDTLGHAVGDKLLQLIGQLLKSNIRRDDLAIRVGGDEFLVFMPGCSVERAGEFATRLTALFCQHVRTVLPPDLPVGLSTGVSSMIRDGAVSTAQLLERADRNLYVAKERGKGQTVGA